MSDNSEEGWLSVCENLDTTPPSAYNSPTIDPHYLQNTDTTQGLHHHGMPPNDIPRSQAMSYNVAPTKPQGRKRNVDESDKLRKAIEHVTPENVKAYLSEKSMTQTAFAKALDVPVNRIRSWMQNKPSTWNAVDSIRMWLEKQRGTPEPKKQRSAPNGAQMGINNGGGTPNLAPLSGGTMYPLSGNGQPRRSNAQYNMQDFIRALKSTTNQEDHLSINKALEEYLKERRKQGQGTPVEQKQRQGKLLLQKLKQLCGDEIIMRATNAMKQYQPLDDISSRGQMPNGGIQRQASYLSRQGSNLSQRSAVPSGVYPPNRMKRENSGTTYNQMPQYMQQQQPYPPKPQTLRRPSIQSAPGGATYGNSGTGPSKQQIANLVRAWNHGCQCTDPKCADELCSKIKPSVQHQRDLKRDNIQNRPCQENCKKCIFYLKLCQFSQRRPSKSQPPESGTNNNYPIQGGANGIGSQVQQQQNSYQGDINTQKSLKREQSQISQQQAQNGTQIKNNTTMVKNERKPVPNKSENLVSNGAPAKNVLDDGQKLNDFNSNAFTNDLVNIDPLPPNSSNTNFDDVDFNGSYFGATSPNFGGPTSPAPVEPLSANGGGMPATMSHQNSFSSSIADDLNDFYPGTRNNGMDMTSGLGDIFDQPDSSGLNDFDF